MTADRVGGRMPQAQMQRFTIHQLGEPPQSMTPGMVPGITPVPGLFAVPAAPKESPAVMDTRPVLTPEAVTRDLGLDAGQEQEFRKYLPALMNADNAAVLRQQVMQYAMHRGFDPSVRRLLVERTVKLYAAGGKAQGREETLRRQLRSMRRDGAPTQQEQDMQRSNAFVVDGDYLRKADDTPAGKLRMLLSTLQAMRECYQAMHWSANGESAYGDHLLYERLYESIADEVDGLAEKLLGLGEAGSRINPQAQLEAAAGVAARYAPTPAGMLIAEEMLTTAALPALVRELDADGALTMGLDSLLQGIAETHEGHVYLLKQRVTPDLSIPLAKGEPRGGKYHARTTDHSGKYRYHYDAERFASSKHAPVMGATVLKDRLRKELMDKVGDNGAGRDALQFGDRYPDGMVADLIKELTDNGHLIWSDDVLKKPGEPVTIRPEIFGIDADKR